MFGKSLLAIRFMECGGKRSDDTALGLRETNTRRVGIWACRYVWKQRAFRMKRSNTQARAESGRVATSGSNALRPKRCRRCACHRSPKVLAADCSEAANRTPGSRITFGGPLYGVRWQAKRRHRFGMTRSNTRRANLGVSLRLEATRFGQSGVVASLATAVQRFSRPIAAKR